MRKNKLFKKKEVNWEWFEILPESRVQLKGVHLKVSNDHPFDQELEDEGIPSGTSEMCRRCLLK
jgi:hypothetical protein